MKVKVQTLDAQGSGEIELRDDVFGLDPRADILHRVVTWQLEKRRGTARPTRERSDVARTGKKFGRQKGGGTARHGDRRAPIFVGGGKAHGARLRDFNPSLNKKIRALGLKMALSSKAKAGQLIIMDSLMVVVGLVLLTPYARVNAELSVLLFKSGSKFLCDNERSILRRVGVHAKC